MARLTGRLVFDRNRVASYSAGMVGISNVAIVLQDLVSGLTLAVLTDTTGNYQFDNVPSGNYQIVEYYGFTETVVVTPGDFNNAFVSDILNGGITPPISYVINPPQGSTNLDCTIKNTFLVTVSTTNLTNNFLNGPVKYTPIEDIIDDTVIILTENLISLADCGTFGKFPAGTNANTGANPNPYPEVVTNFHFVQPNPSVVTPNDGQYTIQNIMSNSHSNQVGTWWRIADHTFGNETGRMMVVNGYSPGAIIYGETVAVLPNTYYLFSAWILNLCFQTGYVDPAFGVRIYDESGEILYSSSLGSLIAKNTYCPEWRQIGTALYSENNTFITVQFISEGPAATGNDYVLDDIKLNPIIITPYSPIKSADTDILNVGEIVTYTVTLENLGANPLTDVIFVDMIPDGLMFVPGSVIINGTPDSIADPNIGFSVPSILSGEILSVVFSAEAVSVPNINPTLNSANITYSYSPVSGGIPSSYSEDSNEVSVYIVNADLSITKRSDSESVSPGEILTYIIQIENKGPDDAKNVILTDETIIGLSDVEYSIDDGDSWDLWTGSYPIGTLDNGSIIEVLIRGTVSDDAPNVIVNTAIVSSDTLDPNLDNNTDTVDTDVEFSADISVLKIPNTSQVVFGSRLTYTMVITNNGPDTARNVVVEDVTPTYFSDPLFSVDDGITWLPWATPYSFGNLVNGESKVFYIEGIIGYPTTDSIVNTVVISSDTPDPDLDNNTDTAIVTFQSGADLSITKVGSPKPVIVGEKLLYTIVVTNNGPEMAENVIVTDDIPEGLIDLEFSIDNGDSWNLWVSPYTIGDLNPDGNVSIFIRGTVTVEAGGSITNTIEVSSDTPDPDLDNNTDTDTTVVMLNDEYADLLIVKTSDKLVVRPCNVITYTMVISNEGPYIATNVVLRDIVPDSLYHVRYSLNSGKTWQIWNSSLNLGNLDAGDEVSVLIKGVVKSRVLGDIINTAIVSSDTPDPNLDNNTSTNITVFQRGCFRD